jgi:hypothetical protein
MDPHDQQAISLKVLAPRVGLSLTRVKIEIALGNIHVFRSGRRVLCRVSEIEAFFQRLEAQQRRGTKAASGRDRTQASGSSEVAHD